MAPTKATKKPTSGLVTAAPKGQTKKKDDDDVVINVALPRDVHLALRMRALEEGLTLREAITAAAQEWAEA